MIILRSASQLVLEEFPSNPFKLRFELEERDEKFLGKNIEVQSLNLTDRNLISLPLRISMFSNLKFLYLQRNWILSIPACIGMLTELEELDVSNNALISVPKQIFYLKK